jgi:phospholipid/cholesterol/gamma-HCH transport system permease protein
MTTPERHSPAAPHGPHRHDPSLDSTEEAIEETVSAAGEGLILWPRLAAQAFVAMFVYLGEIVALLGQTLVALRRGVNVNDLVRQMSVIGVETVPIALMTVGFSGAVLALYSVDSLRRYGASNLVGGIVAIAIVRETGPILAGVVTAARAGSAMTAEIASMKVSEQIDALRTMAVSPISYLVLPRTLASFLVLPLLGILSNVAGVIGGSLVAAANGVPYTAYFNSIHLILWADGRDVTRGLFKTFFFGIIVALVGCREGLNTSGGAVGVGKSTTRCVVISIVLIFAANFFLSFLLFQSGLF